MFLRFLLHVYIYNVDLTCSAIACPVHSNNNIEFCFGSEIPGELVQAAEGSEVHVDIEDRR